MRLAAAGAVLRLATVLVLAVITTQLAQAQTFTTLHAFVGTDGASPYGGLVQATDGSLYGTTVNGNLAGTVFKIASTGTLTTLHEFIGTDGDQPWAGLIQDTNGNCYGTTIYGGANNAGTVFKITPSGTVTTLYSFCPQSGCADGENPIAWLAQAKNGNLYGTTNGGGVSGSGTIFEITLNGELTTLHSFCSTIQNGYCLDGEGTYAGLIQATNGDLYGTTVGGGVNDGGTVFKLTLSGTLTTLYSFCSQGDCLDGAVPYAGLVQTTNGDFYGTTAAGGATTNGTVFKITPSGTLTTLHSFDRTDGAQPWFGGLVQASDGNLYGTTLVGGTSTVCTGGCGTVFKITLGGTFTTLHNFESTDGSEPAATLVQDTNGTLYGSTYYGGSSSNDGTVFSLSVGLGPFVETRPASGRVGAAVKILGTNLTRATKVTFNGIAATFTVVSKSEITTTVPTGSTSGKVDVTDSKGTLKSNTIFRVTR